MHGVFRLSPVGVSFLIISEFVFFERVQIMPITFIMLRIKIGNQEFTLEITLNRCLLNTRKYVVMGSLSVKCQNMSEISQLSDKIVVA